MASQVQPLLCSSLTCLCSEPLEVISATSSGLFCVRVPSLWTSSNQCSNSFGSFPLQGLAVDRQCSLKLFAENARLSWIALFCKVKDLSNMSNTMVKLLSMDALCVGACAMEVLCDLYIAVWCVSSGTAKVTWSVVLTVMCWWWWECVGIVALAFHFPPSMLWFAPLMSWSGIVMSLSQLTYCPQVLECCPGPVWSWQLCSVFPAHIVFLSFSSDKLTLL